jgi:hypothetical protein
MISEQPVRGSFASNVQYGLRNAADGTRRVCREQLVYLVGMLSKPTLLGSALISFAKPARSGSRGQEAARLGLQSSRAAVQLQPEQPVRSREDLPGHVDCEDGTTLTAGERMPTGVPLTIAVERPEEFSPGLDPELTALIQATADLAMADTAVSYGPGLRHRRPAHRHRQRLGRSPQQGQGRLLS